MREFINNQQSMMTKIAALSVATVFCLLFLQFLFFTPWSSSTGIESSSGLLATENNHHDYVDRSLLCGDERGGSGDAKKLRPDVPPPLPEKPPARLRSLCERGISTVFLQGIPKSGTTLLEVTIIELLSQHCSEPASRCSVVGRPRSPGPYPLVFFDKNNGCEFEFEVPQGSHFVMESYFHASRLMSKHLYGTRVLQVPSQLDVLRNPCHAVLRIVRNPRDTIVSAFFWDEQGANDYPERASKTAWRRVSQHEFEEKKAGKHRKREVEVALEKRKRFLDDDDDEEGHLMKRFEEARMKSNFNSADLKRRRNEKRFKWSSHPEEEEPKPVDNRSQSKRLLDLADEKFPLLIMLLQMQQQALESVMGGEYFAQQLLLPSERAENHLMDTTNGRLHTVYYEEIVEDVIPTLQGIAYFFGIEPSERTLRATANAISLDSMREKDEAHELPGNKARKKVREGRPGGYVEVFSSGGLACLEAWIHAPHMRFPEDLKKRYAMTDAARERMGTSVCSREIPDRETLLGMIDFTDEKFRTHLEDQVAEAHTEPLDIKHCADWLRCWNYKREQEEQQKMIKK